MASDAAGNAHAFLVTGGTMWAVDSRVVNGTGWAFVFAGVALVSIASDGTILGRDTLDGVERLYELVPVVD